MINLFCLMSFIAICLLLRLVVLARRISEQLNLRGRIESNRGVMVEIGCDTSQFDAALKVVTERAKILAAAFESALRVGVKP